MINLIKASVRKLLDFDGATGVQTLTTLHEVKRESLVKIGRRNPPELIPNLSVPDLRILVLKGLKSNLQLLIAALRPLALVPLVLITRDFDENVLGRVARNARDFIHDADRLVQAPANRR